MVLTHGKECNYKTIFVANILYIANINIIMSISRHDFTIAITLMIKKVTVTLPERNFHCCLNIN